MPKRSFSDISQESNPYEAVSQIVQHAEALLQAAKALKKDLDVGKRNEEATARLTAISNKILPAVEVLGSSAPSHKVSKSGRVESVSEASSITPSASIRIPPAVALTPWSTKDFPLSLPPLPPILDPVLDQAAFTHSGLVFKPGDMSYERLEWIGDAYLYLLSTAFIYQTFPDLPTGRCSQYRERLVRNVTLSKYTLDYELNKRARFPPEFNLQAIPGGNSVTEKNKRKVLGDIFEAYVAGAILGDPEQGLSRVSSWMKVLWSSELAEEIRAISKKNQQAPPATAGVQEHNPKVLLSQAVGAKGINLTYRDQGEPKLEKKSGLPWYTVGVYLDGWGVKNHLMGFGSGLSKREAGAKAAQVALDNKKMMRMFGQKKKDFEAAMEAQQESAQ